MLSIPPPRQTGSFELQGTAALADELPLATASDIKFAEHSVLLGVAPRRLALNFPEFAVESEHITMMAQKRYDEVAEHFAGLKARFAWAQNGNQPAKIDNALLFVDNLGGWPGPFIGDLDSDRGREAIARMVRQSRVPDSGALAIVTLAVYCPEWIEPLQFRHGRAVGKIAEAPHGDRIFGFDSIFTPLAFGSRHDKMTYADLSLEQKCLFSMRACAVNALRALPFSREMK